MMVVDEERTQAGLSEEIRERLSRADEGALAGATRIVAVAILYEHDPIGPAGEEVAWPPDHVLASGLVEQYKAPGWIPAELSVTPSTLVAKRLLREGVEVTSGAALDRAAANAILASMLAGAVGPAALTEWSAIAFSGDSVALGRTFFAVLAGA
jgi:hypothetical protein